MSKSLFASFLLLTMCTSAATYRYYDLQLQQGARGTLVHSDPKNNKDLEETCFPKNKCVTLEAEVFFKLVKDFRATKQALDTCERK
jgi:hypothetical protein